MVDGRPLTDDDRATRLDLVGAGLSGTAPVAMACPALRWDHRYRLRSRAVRSLWFVNLVAGRDLLAYRVSSCPDHLMPPSQLDDQLATLELLEPADREVAVDESRPLTDVVAVECSLSP